MSGDGQSAAAGQRRPDITAALARGVQRMLLARGLTPLLELTLANGRRADVAALSPKGEIIIVETKSGVEDFVVDFKWPDYKEYCDAFYFAVTVDFPQALIPEGVGLIVADAYGGDILREAPRHPLVPARRKAVTLLFARVAAQRLVYRVLDEPRAEAQETQKSAEDSPDTASGPA